MHFQRHKCLHTLGMKLIKKSYISNSAKQLITENKFKSKLFVKIIY